MIVYFNEVRLAGLVKSEIRSKKFGETLVAEFELIYAKKIKNKITGEWSETKSEFTIKGYNRNAERMKTLQYNNNVMLAGEVKLETWVDDAKKQKRKTLIVAHRIWLVSDIEDGMLEGEENFGVLNKDDNDLPE